MQPESSAARICGQQRQRIRGKASKTGFPGRARKTEKMPSQRGGTLSNHLVPHIHTLDLAGKNAPAARGHPLKPSCTSHSCSRFCRQKCPPQRGGTPSNHLVPHIHALDLAGKSAPRSAGAPSQTLLYLTFMLSILPEKMPPQRGGTPSNPLVPHIHALDLAGKNAPAARGHPLKPSCTSHSCSRSCRKKCPRSAGAPPQTILYLTFMLSILPAKMPPQRGGTPSNHLVPHIHALDLAGKSAPRSAGAPSQTLLYHTFILSILPAMWVLLIKVPPKL